MQNRTPEILQTTVRDRHGAIKVQTTNPVSTRSGRGRPFANKFSVQHSEILGDSGHIDQATHYRGYRARYLQFELTGKTTGRVFSGDEQQKMGRNSGRTWFIKNFTELAVVPTIQGGFAKMSQKC